MERDKMGTMGEVGEISTHSEAEAKVDRILHLIKDLSTRPEPVTVLLMSKEDYKSVAEKFGYLGLPDRTAAKVKATLRLLPENMETALPHKDDEVIDKLRSRLGVSKGKYSDFPLFVHQQTYQDLSGTEVVGQNIVKLKGLAAKNAYWYEVFYEDGWGRTGVIAVTVGKKLEETSDVFHRIVGRARNAERRVRDKLLGIHY